MAVAEPSLPARPVHVRQAGLPDPVNQMFKIKNLLCMHADIDTDRDGTETDITSRQVSHWFCFSGDH